MQGMHKLLTYEREFVFAMLLILVSKNCQDSSYFFIDVKCLGGLRIV